MTAIISHTGEPIRNLPWTLYYKPSQYNFPQRGGSCDTTPATPESLLTDSVGTPTDFCPTPGPSKTYYRNSCTSPELTSFSVSQLMQTTPDYSERSLHTRTCTLGRPYRDKRTSCNAAAQSHDNGEGSLYEKLPLSVKTKENPISHSRDRPLFKVSRDHQTDTSDSRGWPFLVSHTTANSSVDWSSSSSLKDPIQSPTSAELALLISPDIPSIQPPIHEDKSEVESLMLHRSTNDLDDTKYEEHEVLKEPVSELPLSISLSDCGRALSGSDCGISGQTKAMRTSDPVITTHQRQIENNRQMSLTELKSTESKPGQDFCSVQGKNLPGVISQSFDSLQYVFHLRK